MATPTIMTSLMRRAWYEATIAQFLSSSTEEVLGALALASGMAIEPEQRDAWVCQIELLHCQLADVPGQIFFEFVIPRMGSRIDTVILLESIVLVVEFKVGASTFSRAATIQVWDYALDLKNFHEGSHDKTIVPILIATEARENPAIALRLALDRVAEPIFVAPSNVRTAIEELRTAVTGIAIQDGWAAAPYRPTPTIVEAARALFANHSVEEIARHDAGAENLRTTSRRVEDLIIARSTLKEFSFPAMNHPLG
jgi:hypothetical protein